MDPSFVRRQQAEALQGRQLHPQGEMFAHPFQMTQSLINHQPQGYVPAQSYLPMYQQNGHVVSDQPAFVQMGPGTLCGSSENKEPGIWIDINIYVNPRNQADLYSKIPNLQKFLSMTGSEPSPMNGIYADFAQNQQSSPWMFDVPIHAHSHEPKQQPSFRSNFNEPAFYSDPTGHNRRNLSGLKVNHYPETVPPYSNYERNVEITQRLDHRNNFGSPNLIQQNRIEPFRIPNSDIVNHADQLKDSVLIREHKPSSQVEVLERIGIRPSNPQPPLSSTEAAFRGFISQVSKEQKPAETQEKAKASEHDSDQEEEDDSEDREEEDESNSENSDEEISRNLKIVPPHVQQSQHAFIPNKNFDFINSVPIKQTSQDILRSQQRPSFSFQHQAGSKITESIPLTKRDVTEFKNEIHVTQRTEDKIANSRNLATQIKKIKYFWRGTNFNYPYTHRRKYQKIERMGDDRFFTEIIDFSKKVIQPNMNIDQKYL